MSGVFEVYLFHRGLRGFERNTGIDIGAHLAEHGFQRTQAEEDILRA